MPLIRLEYDNNNVSDSEAEIVSDIKTKLKQWKEQVNFKHPINLTLIPMDWKVEIGI